MNYSGSQFPYGGECWLPVMNFNPGFNQQAGYQVMASYQCEYCAKLFVHKETYDRHVLSHDVEKIVAGAAQSEGVVSASQGAVSGSQGAISASLGVGSGSQGALSASQGVASGSQGVVSGSQGVGQTSTAIAEIAAAVSSTNSTKSQHKPMPVSKVPQCRPKLHACDECPKSYTRKDHLSRHKLWHIGDRPHVCSICFKSFIRKDKLLRHEKIHAKDTVCNCPVCGKQFLRRDSMNKHLKTHDAHHLPGERKRKKTTTNSSQQTDDVAVMDKMYCTQSKAQPMPSVTTTSCKLEHHYVEIV